LLHRLTEMREPVVLSPETFELRGSTVLSADDLAVHAWYAAGATILIPLRAEGAAGGEALTHRELPREAGTHDGLIGVWVLAPRNVLDLPERRELQELAGIGQQAALLLDYARLGEEQVAHALLRHDLDRAREIQDRLLPQALPSVPAGPELAVRFRPARTVS